MKLMMRLEFPQGGELVEPHLSLAFGTNKRVCFINFSNEVGPALFNSVDNGGASISLISVSSLGLEAKLRHCTSCGVACSDGRNKALVSAGELYPYFGCASITMFARAFGSGGSSLSPAGMPLTENMCAMASMHCWSVSVPGASGGIVWRT